MNFMRGRSITDTWLIIDEAQNLTPRQVKGIVTRVGKGTKVVLLGDPAQIDHPLLDTRSNGVTYASARMRGSPLCVQLTMLPDECQRSPLALDAAVRMQMKAELTGSNRKENLFTFYRGLKTEFTSQRYTALVQASNRSLREENAL